MISLGLFDDHKQVQAKIRAVGIPEDYITFDDFVKLVSSGAHEGAQTERTEPVFTYFKKKLTLDARSPKGSKDVPFSLQASAHRRKQIMNSMMAHGKQRQQGERLLNNYKKFISENMVSKALSGMRDLGEVDSPRLSKVGKELNSRQSSTELDQFEYVLRSLIEHSGQR